MGGWGTSLQLERARGLHPDDAVDGVRAVLRILIVFALVTPFWSLFDQKASTWVIQGNAMLVPHEQWWWPSWLVKEPAQMQALNPLLIMLLIPFNNVVLYPLPVSYTHLDVYKRQHLHRPVAPCATSHCRVQPVAPVPIPPCCG